METKLEGTGLIVKGSCLMQELKPLAESFKEMVNSDRNKIQLDLSEVESIDTAGIQLLAVCRQDAMEKGKTFEIISESEVVRQSLEITGLLSILGRNEK